MKKKKIFIAIHSLCFGGAQKSLISALNAIDYSTNEVTLYVRNENLDLLPLVNKNVSNIIINDDKTDYEKKPYALFLFIISKILEFFHFNYSGCRLQEKRYVNKKKINYEKKRYQLHLLKYDVAISYISDSTAQFVSECIDANRKICFHFDSVDNDPKYHERIFTSFDRIVTDSYGTASMLKKTHPVQKEKIKVIKNYIDYHQVKEQSELFEVERKNTDVLLCTCGRMTDDKGYDIAVMVAKYLKDKNVDFYWYFVGDGEKRKLIEGLIEENNLSGKIELTGMQKNPYPYMKACDIYVQPSRKESYGITITEAKMLNKVIVSTNTVGGSEQIITNKNGILSEINSNEIAKSIIRCLADTSLVEGIISELKSIDYSKEFDDFCFAWGCLLEE